MLDAYTGQDKRLKGERDVFSTEQNLCQFCEIEVDRITARYAK